MTDEYKGYLGMNKILPHSVIKHADWYVDGDIHTNTIESFWALLKRGIFGQFHSVSRRYLQRYVDEFCYRYNRRHMDMSDVFTSTLESVGGKIMSKKQPLKVIAGTPDHPLIIGDIEIQCYVLEDETRVLSQEGFLEAIGRAKKAKGGHGASRVDNPPAFLAPNNLKPFIFNELNRSTTPIPFKGSGRSAYGYRAELLPQVCVVYLEARSAGALLPSQDHIAERADILLRGLATVGIVALVDEATGYQRLREERALATILEKFIAKELQPWTRTFPYEFYEQIYKLKGWQGPDGHKRPSVIGHYTNDIVYDRLAQGVLKELRQRNPTLSDGRRKSHHHQWFTPDLGHPKLKEHLATVTALMRAAPNWTVFKRNLRRAFPKLNEPITLAIDDD